MKKILITILLSIFCVTALVSGTVVMYSQDILLPWQETCIDSTEYPAIEEIKLKFNGQTVNVTAYDILKVDLTKTNRDFSNWAQGNIIPVNSDWSIDIEKFTAILDDLYTANENASIIIDNDNLRLLPHKINMDFNSDKVIEIVQDAIKAGETFIDVTAACNKPAVTLDDLKPVYEAYEWINSFHIEYTDGTAITSKDLLKAWNTELNNLDVSSLDFSELVEGLDDSYNTTSNSLTFKNTHGDEVTVPYKTYGFYVNKKSELEYINNAILNMESTEDRVPELKGYDSFDGTYIEVDISNQHVWHYVNGELHCQSACVTGLKGHHDTPTGVFYISERIGGKYLRGADYKTWVNQWMRLTDSGIGLHDAYWRNSFGKNIYTYNGSHGCINLPPSYAKALYNEVSRGLPVVIYE